MLNDINQYGQQICKTVGLEECKAISKPIPGHYTGNTQHSSTCESILRGMKIDNPDIYKTTFHERCNIGYYKAALVVDPFETYHFFRQDKDGYWSQKNGHDDFSKNDNFNLCSVCNRNQKNTESDSSLGCIPWLPIKQASK